MRPDEPQQLRDAWRSVLAGDSGAGGATRRGCAARPGSRGSRPASATPGCAAGQLDAGDAGLRRGARARAAYLPALLGAGAARARRGDAEAALRLPAACCSASSRGPDSRAAPGRGEAAGHRAARRRRAQAALQRANREHAVAEYRARRSRRRPSWPDLRLELAGCCSTQGDAAEALALLEGEPAGDRRRCSRSADLACAEGLPARARGVPRRSLAARPEGRPTRQQRLLEARRALELLAGCRRSIGGIPGAARVTRADLAALIVGQGPGAAAARRAADPRRHRHLGLVGAGAHPRAALARRDGRVPEPHVPAGGDGAAGRPGGGAWGACSICSAVPARPAPAMTDMSPDAPAVRRPSRAWWRRA